MTLEIALVLAITIIAVILFVSNKLRVDLVALLVLVALVVTQLITPEEALSGFSNPAVVTVWAVFILSAGLARTGIANAIGQQVMRLAGSGEVRLMALIMLTAAVLSAFMNNIGVAALLLPVVMEIARRTHISPSRLLLPLAIGALLGGMTTLIGTPPNILASEALREAGLVPFGMFDYAPLGLTVMIAGMLFMVLIGRRLLPSRDLSREAGTSASDDLEQFYQLQEQLLVVQIPEDSTLAGMSLADSQLGTMLDYNVVAIVNNGQTQLSPGPDSILETGDQLLAIGKPDYLADLRNHRVEMMERMPMTLKNVREAGIELAILKPLPGSSLIGKSLEEAAVRQTLGLNVLAVCRGEDIYRRGFPGLKIRENDKLLVQNTPERMAGLHGKGNFTLEKVEPHQIARLQEQLLLVRIPRESALTGRTLLESRLGQSFGLTVLRINRGEETLFLPDPGEKLMAGDSMLVQGIEEDIAALRGLEELQLGSSPHGLEELESSQVGLTEAVLAPRSNLAGKTLQQLHFREKYGLNVLGIWRGGEAYRADLREMPLRFGDALLLYGPRQKLRLLGSESDFIVLSEEAQPPLRTKKAPIAVAIMVGVLASVMFGWLPIAIAAIIGVTLMVLTQVLTMNEAYRSIEWQAVFLIAAMLPLGLAMRSSGAATYLANGMMGVVGDFGPLVVLAGLFVLSVLASQVMPNAAVVVLMAPIALAAANDLDVSPYAFMMGIAVAASASFMSPVSHPANILVMGPGGYKFSDYIRVGLPLTLVVLVVVLIVLPLVWSF
jgi:di/tricarboxylate transporter